MKRRPVQQEDGEPTDWPGSALVSDFLTRQLAGRRLAALSCLTYGRSLKGFALWMKSNGGWDGDWSKLTARNLRDFVIERQGTHNRRSVHNQVSALRAFLADLRERVRKTLAYVDSVPAAAVDGSEGREIVIPMRTRDPLHFTGEVFLKHWALPNFFFHISMAYALLRQAGVELGKSDFLATP